MRAFLFPGQGSQKKGMGAHLFPKYPDHVKKASDILGYSIEELCVSDPENNLNYTAYTQPAIFVVSALNYLETLKIEGRPDFVAGHSIGEYTALFAAEVFDFETGLHVVKKRAELMSQATGGALAAVVGLSHAEVESRIKASNLPEIEIANINSPTQIVIGAPIEIIKAFAQFCEGQSGRVITLKVSGAFHTSYMRQTQEAFGDFLSGIAFQAPLIPVVSNYTAQFHNRDDIAENLANHLANRVRWTECIETLFCSEVETFVEIGSKILTPMVNEIREQWITRLSQGQANQIESLNTQGPTFCSTFGFGKPMVVGGTGYGLAGAELISNLAHHGILSFLDTSGRSLTEIENVLQSLCADASIAGKYGVSLTFNPDATDDEDLIALCLSYSIRFLELRGYYEPSPALLRYRFEGGQDDKGRPNNRVLLRASDADMAMPFLDADDTSAFPIVDAICVDTQSWRSVKGNDFLQFNEIRNRCDQIKSGLPFGKIFVGLSGLAVAEKPVEAAIEMGADFALLASVFLLTEESGLDGSIKTVLSNTSREHFKDIFDWAYPACRTTSFGHVMNEEFSGQISALQELYLQDELNTNSLRELSNQHTHRDENILSEQFINACEGMNKFEMRAAVRKRIQASSFPYILHCESPFPGLTNWLGDQGETFPIGAAKLANLIYSTPLANLRG